MEKITNFKLYALPSARIMQTSPPQQSIYCQFEAWYTREVAESFGRKETNTLERTRFALHRFTMGHMRLSEKGAFALCPTKHDFVDRKFINTCLLWGKSKENFLVVADTLFLSNKTVYDSSQKELKDPTSRKKIWKCLCQYASRPLQEKCTNMG